MGVRPQVVHQNKVIRTPLVPDPTWERVGVTIMYGGEPREVYRRLKPLPLRSELVEVTNDRGEVVHKRDKKGDPMDSPRTRRVELSRDDERSWEEFILDDTGNGNVISIPWDRKAQAAAEERKRQKEARQRNLDRILDALAASDVSPEDLVARLSAIEPTSAHEGAKTSDEGEAISGVRREGRWWMAYLNGQKVGSGKETEEEAQALFLRAINGEELDPEGGTEES